MVFLFVSKYVCTPIRLLQILLDEQDVHSTLYYAVLSRHTYECMPFVYTPVVGEACQKFSQIYRHTPQVRMNANHHFCPVVQMYVPEKIFFDRRKSAIGLSVL